MGKWSDIAQSMNAGEIKEPSQQGTSQQNRPLSEPVNNAGLAFNLNAKESPTPITEDQVRGLKPGQTITVMSPLFGEFKAVVLLGNRCIVWVYHPVLKQESAIPVEWIKADSQ